MVILAYNEETTLEGVVRSTRTLVDTLPTAFEILVVDDGSTDNTGQIADDLAGSLPRTRVLHHERNLGLGGGYRTGLVEARGEVLTFFPADGQYPAKIVAAMAPLMAKHDLVLGYVKQRTDSRVGAALSAGERTLYRLLFGPLPRFQGICMFRRSLAQRIELNSRGRGWGVIMELIVRAVRSGASHTSIPIPIFPRQDGHSKAVTPTAVLANLRELLLLAWRLKNS